MFRFPIGIACAALSAVVVFDASYMLAEPPSIQIDDPLEPLRPTCPRAEVEQDRIEAIALFATGRMHQHQAQRLEDEKKLDAARHEQTRALRHYQRAFRRDPQAISISAEIVQLAQSLERADESARYAALAIEQDASDPSAMRWLALYFTEQGELQRAITLYEQLVARTASSDASRTEAEQAQQQEPLQSASDMALQLELGRLYWLTKNYPKASAAFAAVQAEIERSHAVGPAGKLRTALVDSALLTFQLFGEVHLAAGRLDDAEQAFRKAHQAGMKQGLLGYHLARIALQRSQPDLALQGVQQYFDQRLADETSAPYQLLAQILEKLNQQETLVSRLEQLHKQDPDNLPLASFLASTYLNQEKPSDAEAICRKLVDQSSERKGTDALLAPQQMLISIYRKRGDAAALLDVLTTIVAQHDSLRVLDDELLEFVKDEALLERIFQEAEERRQAADSQTLRSAREALVVAELAMLARQFDRAATCYERAMELQPQRAPALLVRWGLELLESDQSDAAAQVFQRGIEKHPGPASDEAREAYQAGLHFYRAGALATSGRTDESLEAARRADQLQPKSALVASRVPWILAHAKQYDQAIQSYQQLIQRFDLEVHDAPTREVLQAARFELSHLLVVKRDLPRAEEVLEQVLDEFPEHVGALNDLGFLWADQGKHPRRALAMIEKAISAQPDNPAYRDSLGWVYYRLGRYDDALRELEKAASNDPPDGMILDHLGDCHHKLNQFEKANETWARAAKTLDETGQADEAARVRQKMATAPP